MASQALQEPAILHLIFLYLDQLDLLRLQRVCRAWRNTINDSKELLYKLGLHPGTKLKSKTTSSEEHQPTAKLNPLLQKHFVSLFWGLTEWDGHRGNSGPFIWLAERHWTTAENWLDEAFRQRFTNPHASWRKMCPWQPAMRELVVHVVLEQGRQGAVARLAFDNETSWLTMGLLWDLVEGAWMRGAPWWVQWMRVQGPSGSTPWPWCRELIPEDARVPEEVRESVMSRPGRVCVTFVTDGRTREERTVAKERALRERVTSIKKIDRQVFRFCGTRPRRVTAFDRFVFTDEFRVEGAKGFAEVEWDEYHEYEIPREQSAAAVSTEVPERRKRKVMGIRWGR